MTHAKPLTIQQMHQNYPMKLWCPICKQTIPHKRLYVTHRVKNLRDFMKSEITEKVECQQCGLRTRFLTMSNWKGNPLQKSENVMQFCERVRE